jgi:hypothetical protein
MPNILTSWKEISEYLGKSVRTVQRWEREAGLPVRHAAAPAPQGVFAFSRELDAWARTRTRGPSAIVAGTLRRELAILRRETDELRARLKGIEAAVRARRK